MRRLKLLFALLFIFKAPILIKYLVAKQKNNFNHVINKIILLVSINKLLFKIALQNSNI